jgi:hypothetical protein
MRAAGWPARTMADAHYAERNGRCFELCGRAMLDAPGDEFRLLHGTVVVDRGKIPHAWIEEADDVLDFVIGLRFPRVDYYRELRAEPVAIYCAAQARERVTATGHWGPWE